MSALKPTGNYYIDMALFRLSRNKNVFISQASEKNLLALYAKRPAATVRHLTALMIADHLAIPVEKLNYPKHLLSDKHVEVVKDMGRIDSLVKMIDEAGVFDAGRAIGKKAAHQEDIFDSLSESFSVADSISKLNKSDISEIEKEIAINLTIYSDLCEVRMYVYEYGRLKGAALRDTTQDPALRKGEADFDLARAGAFLNAMVEKFPFGTQSYHGMYRDQIAIAAAQLLGGNNSRANTVLVYLTKRIEQDIRNLQRQKDDVENKDLDKAKGKKIDDPLKEAEKRYGITFTQEGKVVVPQGGHRKVGKVYITKKTKPEIEIDKAVRREQDIIDDISKRIVANAAFIDSLGSLLKEVKIAGKYDYEKIEKVLDEILKAYSIKKDVHKLIAGWYLKLARRLLKSALTYYDKEAVGFQVSFALNLIKMTLSEIVQLNRKYSRQIDRIEVKRDLLDIIIGRKLHRDAQLKDVSDFLVSIISRGGIFNSPGIAWWLMKEANNRVKAVFATLPSEIEPGMQRCVKRFKAIKRSLAAIGRLNREKENFRNYILEARKRYSQEVLALKKKGDNEAVSSLLNSVRRQATRYLAKIKEYNGTVRSNLEWAAQEALLIRFDMENKERETTPEEERQYLESQQKVFDRITNMDQGYQMVKDKDGRYLGEALPYDIRKLDLIVSRTSGT